MKKIFGYGKKNEKGITLTAFAISRKCVRY